MLALFIAIVVFFAVIHHYHDTFYEFGSKKLIRFAQIASPFAEDTTLYGRLTTRPTYQIPMMLQNPFGIGVGHEEALGAHNNYFTVILQVGWIGGILFLFILYRSLLLCFNTYEKLKHTEYSQLSLGILAASLAMFASGIPNKPFGYDCAIFFWLFLGMVENLPVIYRRQIVEYK